MRHIPGLRPIHTNTRAYMGTQLCEGTNSGSNQGKTRLRDPQGDGGKRPIVRMGFLAHFEACITYRIYNEAMVKGTVAALEMDRGWSEVDLLLGFSSQPRAGLT